MDRVKGIIEEPAQFLPEPEFSLRKFVDTLNWGDSSSSSGWGVRVSQFSTLYRYPKVSEVLDSF